MASTRHNTPTGVEKQDSEHDAKRDVETASSIHEAQSEEARGWQAWAQKLVSLGHVEVRGIAPIPVEERTVTRTVNIFTLWWCMNANVLPSITFGMLGATKKIFAYTYLGLALPTILLMILGAAIASSIPLVPAWQQAYDENLVGGVLSAMLTPASTFGKIVTVVLSFTLLGNIAATSYSITLNFQLLAPALKRVPRSVFALLITVIIIPVGIRAATDFFASLENFIALIGYWSAAFLSVVLVEHFCFRKADCERYETEAWDDARKLPVGAAALGSCVLCFALVIPCMAQVWWTGPIAEVTGDIGFELAFVVSGLLYVPFRTLERRVSGR
ncbi:Purine-cytosine permease fcyB [Colletotrichum sp. SAR 10_76]|nr:Purine-cytosine permease fcyB [Colletotrichum sp. SAR 10_76]